MGQIAGRQDLGVGGVELVGGGGGAGKGAVGFFVNLLTPARRGHCGSRPNSVRSHLSRIKTSPFGSRMCAVGEITHKRGLITIILALVGVPRNG